MQLLSPSQHLDMRAEKHVPSKPLGVKNHPEYLELNNSLSTKLHGKGEWNIKDVLRAEQEHLPWQVCLWAARRRLHKMSCLEVSLHISLLQRRKFVRT